jgi:putative Ca2+/H+ antiporter (TMEM165/GDT1 family)
MHAFLVSAILVALAEMGDKTQLLSLVLAARFRRPWPIVLGVLAATVANHALAAGIGAWLTQLLGQQTMRYIVAASFLGMAAWALVPDKPGGAVHATGHGVFAATTLAFFLAEMGDKTQLATVALAARYATVAPVVIGTTIGMLAANVPVIFAGERIAARLPLVLLRRVAAALFALLGILALIA